jgi:hypothetical protein
MPPLLHGDGRAVEVGKLAQATQNIDPGRTTGVRTAEHIWKRERRREQDRGLAHTCSCSSGAWRKRRTGTRRCEALTSNADWARPPRCCPGTCRPRSAWRSFCVKKHITSLSLRGKSRFADDFGVPVVVDRKSPQLGHGRELGVVREVIVVEDERVQLPEALEAINISVEVSATQPRRKAG